MRNNIKDFFNAHRDVITLPLLVRGNENVFTVLYYRLEQYVDIIKENVQLEKYLNEVSRIVEEIKAIIDSYFHCNDEQVYTKTKDMISFFERLEHTYVVTMLGELFSESDDEQFEWYRGRIGSFQHPFGYSEMSHIPFSQRNLMSNARYSINGVPCLYVSNSTYCVWEELKRPSFDSIWISKVALNDTKKLKVLNLSITAGDLLNEKSIRGKFEDNLRSFILSWPLQCACSIVADGENNGFKEEYIFPQILMRVAYSLGVDAFMYFSNRVKNIYTKPSSWILKNLAIPAFDYHNISNGYSPKLSGLITVTNPINLGLFSEDLVCHEKLYKYNTNHIRQITKISVDNEATVLYPQTIFWRVEVVLAHRESHKLNADD